MLTGWPGCSCLPDAAYGEFLNSVLRRLMYALAGWACELEIGLQFSCEIHPVQSTVNCQLVADWMVSASLTCFLQMMEQFLSGANAMDDHFRSAPLESNLPVLMGLTSVWNISFLGYPARAILPYCQVSECSMRCQHIAAACRMPGSVEEW